MARLRWLVSFLLAAFFHGAFRLKAGLQAGPFRRGTGALGEVALVGVFSVGGDSPWRLPPEGGTTSGAVSAWR
jgi:hypothetical protein